MTLEYELKKRSERAICSIGPFWEAIDDEGAHIVASMLHACAQLEGAQKPILLMLPEDGARLGTVWATLHMRMNLRRRELALVQLHAVDERSLALAVAAAWRLPRFLA